MREFGFEMPRTQTFFKINVTRHAMRALLSDAPDVIAISFRAALKGDG